MTAMGSAPTQVALAAWGCILWIIARGALEENSRLATLAKAPALCAEFLSAPVTSRRIAKRWLAEITRYDLYAGEQNHPRPVGRRSSCGTGRPGREHQPRK